MLILILINTVLLIFISISSINYIYFVYYLYYDIQYNLHVLLYFNIRRERENKKVTTKLDVDTVYVCQTEK